MKTQTIPNGTIVRVVSRTAIKKYSSDRKTIADSEGFRWIIYNAGETGVVVKYKDDCDVYVVAFSTPRESCKTYSIPAIALSVEWKRNKGRF